MEVRGTDGWDTEDWGSLEEEPESEQVFILLYYLSNISKTTSLKQYTLHIVLTFCLCIM